MFIQVIQGRTSDAGALRAALDRWAAEVAPSAMASSIPRQVLRRTAGSSPWPASSPPRPPAVTAPGPSRTRGGAETAALLDGEVTFRDSEDVDLDLVGDPDRAGFVQIMQGWTNDPQRARELMASSPVEWASFRPDVLGSVTVDHGDGGWTSAIYFTSEAEARVGERREPPPELRAQMAELESLADGPVEFYDLTSPWLYSP